MYMLALWLAINVFKDYISFRLLILFGCDKTSDFCEIDRDGIPNVHVHIQ